MNGGATVQKPIDKKYKLYIGGEWVESKEGKTFDVFCPANGEMLATCADAGKEDVDAAVQAASKAFETWKHISAQERAALLMKIADLIDANAEKLALIETLDTGKPIRETGHMDVPLASDHFRYYASAIRSEEGQAVKLDKDTLSIILREPLGVVGQIIAWNFPLLLMAWKTAPALAAGNTIVLKPSSSTSLSALEFVKLVDEVLPPGVLNVVTGKGSTTGNYVLEHPGFKKFSFTGSSEVGYDIAKAAAQKLIPATLELGGKSANIFFADCPWDKAIEGVQIGILLNQGEVCCAGSRVFVQEDIYDKFLSELVAAFENIKVGLPWEEDTIMGSVINEAQLNKVLAYVEVGKQEGARLATGGKRITNGGLDKGCFMAPTIFADVDNNMRIAQEEIFGPVACVTKFKDEREVIDMANDNDYGLGGAVWTKDINRALRVAQSIETGRMWINVYNMVPAHAPFGGYKKSGIGRETHKMALDHYSQIKNIFIHMGEEKLGFY